MSRGGWIGVDLDGTLAFYDTWKGPDHIGVPVPSMVDRVKRWRAEGLDVRIFTARAANATSGEISRIARWSLDHLGEVLPITATKDFGMRELWDDRAVTVRKNTGEILTRVAG